MPAVALGGRLSLGLAAAAAALSFGACGRLDRASTVGSAATGPTVAGAALATTLQRELAARGVPAASVTCAHKVLVHVGTTATCSYKRAGRTELVTFRLADRSGSVVAGSVTTR
jgi:hypothetical protein